MSCAARQKAKQNRERRERERERKEQEREREEWLRANKDNPALLLMKAAVNGWAWEHGKFQEFRQSHADDPIPSRPREASREWGLRGPRHDPVRDVRDYVAAYMVKSARSAGWSYHDALAFGAAAIRHLGFGERGEKSIEAMRASTPLPKNLELLCPSEVEAAASIYRMAATIRRIKK
jgi:hypothetical protein